jgi:hypothetical protein
MEESSVLKTKAMRDLDLLRNAKVYLTTIIRVIMPDRSSLVATFRPTETIDAVEHVVREALAPSWASKEFYLYVRAYSCGSICGKRRGNSTRNLDEEGASSEAEGLDAGGLGGLHSGMTRE